MNKDLTLEKAFDESLLAWNFKCRMATLRDPELINEALVAAIPRMADYNELCAMCQYQLNNTDDDTSKCSGCVLGVGSGCCDGLYYEWYSDPTEENALAVYNYIASKKLETSPYMYVDENKCYINGRAYSKGDWLIMKGKTPVKIRKIFKFGLSITLMAGLCTGIEKGEIAHMFRNQPEDIHSEYFISEEYGKWCKVGDVLVSNSVGEKFDVIGMDDEDVLANSSNNSLCYLDKCAVFEYYTKAPTNKQSSLRDYYFSEEVTDKLYKKYPGDHYECIMENYCKHIKEFVKHEYSIPENVDNKIGRILAGKRAKAALDHIGEFAHMWNKPPAGELVYKDDIADKAVTTGPDDGPFHFKLDDIYATLGGAKVTFLDLKALHTSIFNHLGNKYGSIVSVGMSGCLRIADDVINLIKFQQK